MNLNINEVEFSSTDSQPEDDSGGVTPVDMGDDSLSFTAGRSFPESADLDGFSEHGVRENRNEGGDLESVDVVYEAMEPGPPEDRNGVRITEEFLRSVAEKNYSQQEPYMLGHSDRPLDEVGKMRDVWFSETAGKLMVMNRVFNTGAQTHDEVISRLTHEPPTMTDGSVGFGNNYEAVVNENEEPELIDGQIREFSTVPFPGGYDDGGVGLPSTAFAEKVMEKADSKQFAEGELLDDVYERYTDAVNMTDEELTAWAQHPCADAGSNNHEDIRTKNLMLLGTPREGWSDRYIQPATETIQFIERMKDKMPERPATGGPGTCPSGWAIQMLNRGFNPLDGMPDGVPDPGSDYSSVEVNVINFDDGADEGESPENSDGAVTEKISF